jgi:hypothetical protein
VTDRDGRRLNNADHHARELRRPAAKHRTGQGGYGSL